MRWSDYDATNEGVNHRAYEFDYDGLNRLTDANHFKDNASTNEYSMEVSNYDLNGNIKNLNRDGKGGTGIDNLSYSYIGNQLVKVTDGDNNAEVFDNGSSGTGTDYTYDLNGNMTSDANKGISDIDYNHLNLPTKVTFDASNFIEYQYDAAGIKLQQKVTEGGSVVKTTDYVGEFIYEDGSLQLIQQEEGRIIPLDPSHPEFSAGSKEHDYQYHLKDHLGNVRMTFSTTPEAYTQTATFEDAAATQEATFFGNLDPRVTHPAGGKGARLNNAAPAGPYAVLSINKGDEVDLSVDGYYNGGSGYAAAIPAATFTNALSQAVQTSQVLEGLSTTMIDNGIGAAIAAFGVGGSPSNTIPGAYLTYIIFDKEMNYQNIYGYVQIGSAANGSRQTIQLNNIAIDRDGFMVVYLSNESNSANYVYFDNFQVDHTKTNIVSTQDYYPFGLTFNENVRTASTEQRFKYNGKELQEETGWYDYQLRQYDPELGVWHAIDPSADSYYSWSPYSYVFNNPIRLIDPDGADPYDAVRSAAKGAWNSFVSTVKGVGDIAAAAQPGTQQNIRMMSAISSFFSDPRGTVQKMADNTVNGAKGAYNQWESAPMEQKLEMQNEALGAMMLGAATEKGLGTVMKTLDNVGDVAKVSNFALDDIKVDDLDILQGNADLGWYDGETLSLSINSIQKNPLSDKNSGFSNLINYAENLAKDSGLSDVRLEFGPVMNSRLATDATWAKEYGYFYSSYKDDLGNTVVTWEKTLD